MNTLKEILVDAARYRWLRVATDEQLAKVRGFSVADEDGKLWLPEGEEFDNAIDHVMGQEEFERD